VYHLVAMVLETHVKIVANMLLLYHLGNESLLSSTNKESS